RVISNTENNKGEKEKEEEEGTRKPAKDASASMREWDRTIQDAIEQARRELTNKEKEEPKQAESKPPPDDYVTTLGRVMVELPIQLESFFDDGLDPSIYTEQIRFTEPRHSGVQFTGRSQYMGMTRVLRIAMNAWFSSPTMTILMLRQQPVSAPSSPDSGSGGGGGGSSGGGGEGQMDVCVRWVFEGMPRHSEIIGGGNGSRYEGEFKYRIHPKSGLICVHEVSAIHPAPPTGIFATAGLARWMGWLAPRGSLSLSNHHHHHHSYKSEDASKLC
ncbi:hypothetical protein GGI00_004056, partial [Coemansia sp. RSA 2681]